MEFLSLTETNGENWFDPLDDELREEFVLISVNKGRSILHELAPS